MISASEHHEAVKPKRWHWFSKSVRFDDCPTDNIVFCKPKAGKFWQLKRFGKCNPEDTVIKAETEKSVRVKFGDVPGNARIAFKKKVRHSSDVREFMLVKGGEYIPTFNKNTGKCEYKKFMDCRVGDVVLRRVPVEPNWGSGSVANCEYSDMIACLDIARIKTVFKSSLLCAVGLATITYFSRSTHNEASIKPVAVKKPSIAQHKATAEEHIQVPSTTPPKPSSLGYENGIEILALSVRTNNTGAVIEKLKLADGTSKTKIHPKPPLFDNPSDQVIAMAISAKPGDSMPPLPDLTGIDQDFANSLLSPIVINDDDSDEERHIKEMVIEVRKTLAEEIKNGGTVMDALMAHQAEMNRIYENRLEAILLMQKICAEEGLNAAQEFADAVNDAFEQDGIPAIPVIGRGRNQHRTSK